MIKIPPKHSDENLRKKRKELIEMLTYNTEIRTKYNGLVSNLSLRAKNVLRYHDLWDAVRILPWLEGQYDDFSILRNCGQKTSQELALMLEEFRSFVYPFLLEVFENKTINTSDISLEIEEVNNVFEGLLATLSVRAYNVLERAGLLNVDSFCRFFYNFNVDPKSLPQCGAKSAVEIKQMVYALQKYTKQIVAQRDSAIASENNTLTDVAKESPLEVPAFLSEQDKDFVIDFKTKHGHWPMFYLLQAYFIQSTRKIEKIFATIWGMCDGRVLSLIEGAKILGQDSMPLRRKITYLIDHPSSKVSELLKMEDWRFYSVINTQYCVNVSYEEIMHEEHLNNELCVPVLMSFFGKQLYMFNAESLSVSNFFINSASDVPILLDKKYSSLNVRKVLVEINRLSKIKSEQDIRIPLHSYFINNESFWDSSDDFEHMRDEDWQILLLFLEDVLKNFKDISNHNLIIKASIINYKEIVYGILKESGSRMHIDEIFDRLKVICQNRGLVCKFNYSVQIKRFLISDERIVSVGKSSYWGLKEWGGMLGSIKEIAIELLKQSDLPIKINDLAQSILKYRPDSTEKSVVAVIWNTTYSGELILFFDNLVGLPEKVYPETYVRFPQSFEEWTVTFKEFVLKNKRFPRSGKTGYEGYLNRWYQTSKQLVELSPDEINQFEELEKELALFPHNVREEQFLLNCNLYKAFVNQHGRFIRREDDVSLFNWFNGVRRKLSSETFDTYSYNQQKYFISLLKFLLEQPYELDDIEQGNGELVDSNQNDRELKDGELGDRELDDNENEEEVVSLVNYTSIEKREKKNRVLLKPVPKKTIKKIPVPKINTSFKPK